MEETISLIEILTTLKKRIGLIILLALMGLITALAINQFVLIPKYSSEAELLVLPRKSEDQAAYQNIQADVNGNLLMLNTYKDMIKGRLVLGEVSQELKTKHHLNYSTSQLQGIISVVNSQNSQVFQIKAIHELPDHAKKIANTTAARFKAQAHEMLEVSKVTISSEAVANFNPISPNKKLNLMIGLVLGLMLGMGITFLLELLDSSITNEEMLQKEAPYPVLGYIERIEFASSQITSHQEREVYQAQEDNQHA